MDKISYGKITSHFYNLGMQAAHNNGMHKTAVSAKDVAKFIGREAAHTLPTVGAVGGAGAGGVLGFLAGNRVAGAPLREVLKAIKSSGSGLQSGLKMKLEPTLNIARGNMKPEVGMNMKPSISVTDETENLLGALLAAPGLLALAGVGIGAGATLGAVGGGKLGKRGGNLLKDNLLRRLS